jgi:hypothetical protein
MVAGVRGTEFVVELTDSTLTDVGVFEGEVAVGGIDAQGKLVKETEVILKKGYQTKVRKNRKPKSPFKLDKKMIAHQKKLDTLREKAVEKRRDLKKIIDRRLRAHDKAMKKWEKIREKNRQKTKPRDPKMKKEQLNKSKKSDKMHKREKPRKEKKSKK